MTGTTEAFSRVRIDALLEDAGWSLTDGASVLFEHALGDGSRADYVLCDRAGRPMAVVEAKRASVDPIAAQDQGRHYAEQLEVPFVFLSNGDEVWFLDRDADAHAREIATFYSQDDLERRVAARAVRRTRANVPIDRHIVDRGNKIGCGEALSDEVAARAVEAPPPALPGLTGTTPQTARPAPRGAPVGACHATLGAFRISPIPRLHVCQRHYPEGTDCCSPRSLPER